MEINKTWVVIACLAFNIGSISYAFVSNSMNNALKTLYVVFDVSEDEKSFFAGALTSSAYVGALIGAIITTFIKRYHTGIIIADLCLFFGSSILVFNNMAIFFIGRIIAGIGCGMCAVCQPVFIREFSPTAMYSSMGGILSAVFSFGYFLTMLYGVWFPNPSEEVDQVFWRVYFFVGGIPSLIRIIVMKTIYNFQTPIYYLRINNDEMALKVLQKIYKHCDALQLEEIRTQSQTQKTSQPLCATIQKYDKQFKFGLFLMFVFQFCGFNAVVQYSTTIFEKSQGQTKAQFLSFLISVLKWVLYTIAGTITINYGRRNPLILGLSFMFIANAGMFIFSLFENDIMLIVFVFVFVVANFSSTGPIVPVYMPEFVPQQLISYCYYTFWGYSIVILLLFPIASKLYGIGNCFLFFAAITAVGVLVFIRYSVETRNRTNQEIYQLFKRTRTLIQ